MEYEIDKWDIKDFDDTPLNKKNKKDLESVNEYCREHEQYYGNHTCEPKWKWGGDLDGYEIVVHLNKKAKRKFVKKRGY